MNSQSFFLLFITAAATVGCKSRETGSTSKADWLDKTGEKSGTYLVDWPCALRDGGDGKGKLQDEYCEWDRAVPQNGTLVCAFRTTFDRSRKFWLPQRNGVDPDLAHTKSNSLPALVQLYEDCTTDPEAHVDIDRVDPNDHRMATSGKVVGDVDRSSDPTICRTLHELAFVQKKKVTPLPLPARPGADESPGVQLGVRSTLPDGCNFSPDPNLAALFPPNSSAAIVKDFATSEKTFVTCSRDVSETKETCDDLARQLRVGIRFKVESQDVSP